jgi:Leucine-rich repeat (LRR) protein
LSTCPLCFTSSTHYSPISSSLPIHDERQDTNCNAWKRLLDLVEQAAEDGREEFTPRKHLSPEDWVKIVTLPPTIGKLKSVKKLMLYGSNLVRIPPEIGEMNALEEFVPYTSDHLH